MADWTDNCRPIFFELFSSCTWLPPVYWPLRGVRFEAWAVTASDNGEIGRIVGRIGIGATLDGPFDHVVRFPGAGRAFEAGVSICADDCTGDGRGAATTSFTLTCGTAFSVLSDRPIMDFRNHEGFDVELGVELAESFERPISDCFRPRILEADDLGLRGSTASVKYS